MQCPIYNDERMLEPLDVEIFKMLMQYEKGLIRDDIVAVLKVPRTTVYDHLNKWKQYELIHTWSKTHGRGAPYVFFMLSNKGREFVLRAKKEGYFND